MTWLMAWLSISLFPNVVLKFLWILFWVSVILAAWCGMKLQRRFKLSFLWTMVCIMVLAFAIDYVLMRAFIIMGVIVLFCAVAFCAAAIVHFVVRLRR